MRPILLFLFFATVSAIVPKGFKFLHLDNLKKEERTDCELMADCFSESEKHRVACFQSEFLHLRKEKKQARNGQCDMKYLKFELRALRLELKKDAYLQKCLLYNQHADLYPLCLEEIDKKRDSRNQTFYIELTETACQDAEIATSKCFQDHKCDILEFCQLCLHLSALNSDLTKLEIDYWRLDRFCK